MSLLSELQRRNVLRVGTAYVVASWLVIQVAETIFPLFGFDDTPARIVVVVLAIGFIPALVVTWAFELTTEGLKREKDIDRSKSIADESGRTLDRTIMVVLALGLAYFAFDKFVLTESREAKDESYGETSIAVLAFRDMSPDKDQEFLSDGIAEELLNLLAKVPELRVISRTSAFSYKNQEIKLTRIAEELNVDHILEGSIRKSGKQVRITTQLIDARSDTHLWSEGYDRMLDDIFAIQEDIAAMVVQQLKIELLGEAPHIDQVNPEAYELFLQARYLARQGTAEDYEQSEMLFNQALAIDPDFAAAWIGLAITYQDQMTNDLRPHNEAESLAREAVARAVAVDPENPMALSMLGSQAMQFDYDAGAAAQYYRRALALQPYDPFVLGGVAGMLATLGRIDDAITLQKYVVSQDPLAPLQHEYLGDMNFLAEKWDEAIDSHRTALRLSRESRIGAHYYVGIALLLKGDAEGALTEFEKETDDGFRTKGMALAFHDLGEIDRHEALLADFESRWGARWPSGVARAYAYVDRNDQAFHWLDRAIETGDAGLTYHIRQPLFQPVRDDPRWDVALRRVGLSPEQIEGIDFDIPLLN